MWTGNRRDPHLSAGATAGDLEGRRHDVAVAAGRVTGEAEGRSTVVERVGSKLKFLPCHGVVWPRASMNLCARPIWNSAAVTAVRAKVLFCVYNTEHGAGKGLL